MKHKNKPSILSNLDFFSTCKVYYYTYSQFMESLCKGSARANNKKTETNKSCRAHTYILFVSRINACKSTYIYTYIYFGVIKCAWKIFKKKNKIGISYSCFHPCGHHCLIIVTNQKKKKSGVRLCARCRFIWAERVPDDWLQDYANLWSFIQRT